MFADEEKLELFFQVISYGVAITALLTLVASGSIGILGAIFFLLIVVLSWYLEGSKWQISEKLGVVIIIFAIPIFYLEWKYNFSGFSSRDTFTAGNLSRLILVLSSIKLLQKKSDRDWVFIYLISFFEVLLAAGVGISPLFLVFLLIYLLSSFTAIILFEIRKSANLVLQKAEKQKLSLNSGYFNKSKLFRLPFTASIILIFIAIIAVPLFFAFPRVGGAGFGSGLGGLTGFTGFSDSVKLGEIGRLQQNNEIVMRVRVEKPDGIKIKDLRWRGVALDSFEAQIWRKSRFQYNEPFVKTERDIFIVDSAKDTNQIITQTIYLEPIDSPVLFTLARPVALQGNFTVVNKDAEGSLSTSRANMGRVSYKAYSDNVLPSEEELKNDNVQYQVTAKRYLQLPEALDDRIPQLTKQIIDNSGARNRFEQVKAVEKYLQTSFGYTLDLKAGGKDPLADFLFNIREGHCEYFATSLAIMLRTQGIATRIVNGFQTGEYNETAGVYVVRQKDAHSWVEVYFPKEKVWIPFDATPAAGQFAGNSSGSFLDQLNKYVEAMETFWIQYIVSYDNQEQRSLFITLRKLMSELQTTISIWFDSLQERVFIWWQEVRGEKGFEVSVWAIAWGIGYLIAGISGLFIIIWLIRKLIRLKLWERLNQLIKLRKETSIVEFYQRMQKVFAKKGIKREDHQTPLEFAFALNMPQAVKITEKYNEVRFGEKNLNDDEAQEIEEWLKDLERKYK